MTNCAASVIVMKYLIIFGSVTVIGPPDSICWLNSGTTEPDEELTVVAYCTIGHRSSEYAQQLTQRGRRVLNLRGSILAWAHAGGPLVLNSEATRTLHVYGSNWDLAPNRFETVW